MLRIYVWIKDTFSNITITQIVVGVAAIVIALILFGAIVGAVQSPSIIPCQEDEVIIGIGNFMSTGYWDEYVCTHPDILYFGEEK